MYEVSKRMEIAIAHRLNLLYESKCCNIHGHNLIVVVYCRAEKLNDSGMVVDFTEIKRKIHGQLDHKYLNEIEEIGWRKDGDSRTSLNPTAERLAEWICNQIVHCYKVTVQESEGNIATYIAPGAFND